LVFALPFRISACNLYAVQRYPIRAVVKGLSCIVRFFTGYANIAVFAFIRCRLRYCQVAVGFNIHLFLDIAAFVYCPDLCVDRIIGTQDVYVILYGKANMLIHVAVNRCGQIQANHIFLAILRGVMTPYGIRPRLQVVVVYLPNVVRCALYGCEVDGVFFVRKRLHFGAIWVRERAAVEVVGGDGCGEVIAVINYAPRIINLCGDLVHTAVLYMNHIEVANVIERELISGRNRTNSNRLKLRRTLSQLITVYLERFL